MMATWQAAYWGETGLEVYEFGSGRANRLFSGPMDAYEQTKGWPKRRVLVIGRGNFVRLRKRYPPAKIDTLRRAVAVEAPELFPILNPVLHCRIHKTFATHIVLDVWAWEKGPVDELRAVFPFRYAIPEDLAFLSLPPVMHIYNAGSMIHMVACGGGKFYDAMSCRAADFSERDIKKFRAGLAGDASGIGEIMIYGDIPGVTDSTVPLFKRIPGTVHPPSLDAIAAAGFSFGPFRSAEGGVPVVNRPMAFRFAIYAVLACGLSLFVTLQNYDQTLRDSMMLSRTLDKEIALLEADSKENQGEPEVFKKFQEIMAGEASPLRVLDALAADLPEGSHVKVLSLNDGVVEAVFLSRDPLSVIKRLDGSNHFRKLSLKGSPTKDAAGVYACTLLLEMNL